MKRASDFRNKEVINVEDGKRLGFVCDVEVNLEQGKIDSIVIPAPLHITNFFRKAKIISFRGKISKRLAMILFW